MIAFSTEFLQIEKIQGQPKQYLDNIAYKVGQLLVEFDLLLIFLDLLTSGFVLKWEPVCLILHHHQHKFHPISRIITMSPINVLPLKQSWQQHTCWIIRKPVPLQFANHFSWHDRWLTTCNSNSCAWKQSTSVSKPFSHDMIDDWLHATQIIVTTRPSPHVPHEDTTGLIMRRVHQNNISIPFAQQRNRRKSSGR